MPAETFRSRRHSGCRGEEAVMRTELRRSVSAHTRLDAPIELYRASRHSGYAMLTSAEVSLGNAMFKGEAEAWKPLTPA
jgi:hypothetical protein